MKSAIYLLEMIRVNNNRRFVGFALTGLSHRVVAQTLEIRGWERQPSGLGSGYPITKRCCNRRLARMRRLERERAPRLAAEGGGDDRAHYQAEEVLI